jgi:hypothetical protein
MAGKFLLIRSGWGHEVKLLEGISKVLLQSLDGDARVVVN